MVRFSIGYQWTQNSGRSWRFPNREDASRISIRYLRVIEDHAR